MKIIQDEKMFEDCIKEKLTAGIVIEEDDV